MLEQKDPTISNKPQIMLKDQVTGSLQINSFVTFQNN